MPQWADRMIWWHVYPLGFVGAPIRDVVETDVVHRLDRLQGWLDHLVRLGVDGLLLGPVFAATTHGYDTTDHFTIDPRLGDEADLRRLVEAAHDRGIRVLLDGVFNHVGRRHPAFADIATGGTDARPELFGDVTVFEGHDDLVELDHSSPGVADLVADVMAFWLERGIDGWRLDAAYAVPAEFWAAVLPRVRERHPQAWFLGEVIHGDYARIVGRSTMDSLTQYELRQAIWHSLVDRNFFELGHAVGRHVALLDTFLPYTFVGNHDVTRLATAVGADLVPHALAVQFVLAGIPSVYGGDEFGWEGRKEQRLGGDDAVRPAFPVDPGEALSTPDAERVFALHRDLIALRRRHPWLTRARTEVLELANESVALRATDGVETVVALLSVSPRDAVFTTGYGLGVALGAAQADGGGWRLPPSGWALLES